MHVPTSEIGARLVIMTVTSVHGVGGALFQVESNAGIPYLDSPKEKFVDAKLIDMLCKLLTGSALRWHAFAKETNVLENSNPGLRAPEASYLLDDFLRQPTERKGFKLAGKVGWDPLRVLAIHRIWADVFRSDIGKIPLWDEPIYLQRLQI